MKGRRSTYASGCARLSASASAMLPFASSKRTLALPRSSNLTRALPRARPLGLSLQVVLAQTATVDTVKSAAARQHCFKCVNECGEVLRT